MGEEFCDTIDTNAAKSANVNANDYSNDGADYTINKSRTVVDNSESTKCIN